MGFIIIKNVQNNLNYINTTHIYMKELELSQLMQINVKSGRKMNKNKLNSYLSSIFFLIKLIVLKVCISINAFKIQTFERDVLQFPGFFFK